MQLLDNLQIFYIKFSSDSIAQYVERSFLEYYINQEPSIFVDVGSNPVNTVFCCFLFSLFLIELNFSSQLVFYVSCICIETFFLFFRLVACCIC